MGGRIEAKSAAGAGLDLRRPPAAAARRAAPCAKPAPVAGAPAPPESVDARRRCGCWRPRTTRQPAGAEALLAQVGIEPVIVGDGVDAVAAWETGDWDVILMDVQMPRMDGPTATRFIRERELAQRRRRTPIVALTANAMTHQVSEYLAAGMDGFVAKPIEVEPPVRGARSGANSNRIGYGPPVLGQAHRPCLTDEAPATECPRRKRTPDARKRSFGASTDQPVAASRRRALATVDPCVRR